MQTKQKQHHQSYSDAHASLTYLFIVLYKLKVMNSANYPHLAVSSAWVVKHLNNH